MNPAPTTAFLYHPLFREHQTGCKHPESRNRLTAILERLEKDGLLDRMLRLEPQPAPVEAIARVHDPAYIRALAERCAQGNVFDEDSDTVGSPATYDAAVLAAGAVITAADAVMAGTVRNAFCAVRPPGHHAIRDHGMGFCFFNNVAIGARHLQARHGLQRIAILDWDVHHGNGTQDAFYEDPSVFYFSIHQYPLYPGSGRRDQQGAGPGKGSTLNVPVNRGSTDTDYLRVFHEDLRPALDRFQPEFLLVSAGFDAHRDDPLAAVELTEDGYAALTRETLRFAERHCAGRVVSVLEGGYHLEALAASVAAHVRALLGDPA